MNYENIKDRTDKDFKRLTGVPHDIFKQMAVIIEQASAKFGRPAKLSTADRLLLTLMYWREYRTQFHIGVAYSVSEATVCRTIKAIENILIASGQFTLPGKKKLQESDTLIEIVLVDATEQPIERPKKNKNHTTAVRKSVIHKRHN